MSDVGPLDATTRSLVEGGAELVGGATGAAIGILGGPAGAIGGAAVGVAVTRSLKRVGGEIAGTWLGPRQRVRVGAAYATAINEIGRRLDAGEVLRTDGFFAGGETGRATAEEILEGVLKAAGDAHEERKSCS